VWRVTDPAAFTNEKIFDVGVASTSMVLVRSKAESTGLLTGGSTPTDGSDLKRPTKMDDPYDGQVLL
jgi:hypothetical protein